MAKVNAGKRGKSVIVGKKNLKVKANVIQRKTSVGKSPKSKIPQRSAATSKNDANGATLIQRSGKLLKVTQPINDLRQLIKTKDKPQNTTSKNPAPGAQKAAKKDPITKRLGLQSKSAKQRAKVASQVAVANVQSNTGGARKNPAFTLKNRTWQASQLSQQLQQQRQQQPQSILLPQVPPMVMIAAPNVPASTPINAAPQATGFSVIISNLNPSVTHAEISELFGEIGPVQAIQPINSSTSMVTYFNAAHASQAIAEYNNRFLDGQPMQVTLIPAPNPAGNVVRRAFREAFAH